MLCNECGSKISVSDIFCSNCGNKNSNNQASLEENIADVNTKSPVKNQTAELPPRSKAIAVLGVLGVLTIGFIVLKSNSNEYYSPPLNLFSEANDSDTQSSTEPQPIEDAPTQEISAVPEDLGREYAKNLANRMESTGFPACQMLASTIRAFGNSSNPTDIKMRQIDNAVDTAPNYCF